MNPRGTIVLLLLLAAGVLALAPFLGMEPVPLRALWGGVEDYTKVDILWKLRIPRVILAFLAGTALATSGMTFQAMFRNPLATPFTLGVSSGAGPSASWASPASPCRRSSARWRRSCWSMP